MSTSSTLKADFADANNPLKDVIKPYLSGATLNDQAVADLYNARTGPGAATVALTEVGKSDFLKAIRPALLALAGKDATVQAKWDRIIQAASFADMVTIDAVTLGVLALAVADGILTQAQSDAVWHRTGSRAEVLFGAGFTVSRSDVGYTRS
jgi:hypothetical protein